MLAIQSSLKASATIALISPIAILTIPILDTLAAIIRRSLTGRTFYTTDRAHLHHCLLRRGLSNRSVLLWVSTFCLLTVAGALASAAFNNELFAILASLAVVCILVVGRIFGYAEFLLLKARLMRSAYTFLQGGVQARSRPIKVQLQGSADWNEVWNNLMVHATELNLFGVCLNVNVPALHEGYHAQWGRLTDAIEEGGLSRRRSRWPPKDKRSGTGNRRPQGPRARLEKNRHACRRGREHREHRRPARRSGRAQAAGEAPRHPPVPPFHARPGARRRSAEDRSAAADQSKYNGGFG